MFTPIAGPIPVSYTDSHTCASTPLGSYGPFEHSGTLFCLDSGDRNPGFINVWSKSLSTPGGAWTKEADPPSGVALANPGGIYFDGSKIWYLAPISGGFQLTYFDCATLAWTSVGGTAGSNIYTSQPYQVLPMPDGSTLIFATNSTTNPGKIGFYRVDTGGTWSSFQIMHDELTSLGGIGGIAVAVNDGVGNTAHVMYVDGNAGTPTALNVYYRKVFADNSISAEQSVGSSSILNISVGYYHHGSQALLSGSPAIISGGRMFVAQTITYGPGFTNAGEASAWVSTALDDTTTNPSSWAHSTIFTVDLAGADSGPLFSTQFVEITGVLNACSHYYVYDASSIILADKLWASPWTGSAWDTGEALFNFQETIPTLPTGLPGGPGGVGWGGSPGNEAISPSVYQLSNGHIGVMADYGISDPGGHYTTSGFNISYYTEYEELSVLPDPHMYYAFENEEDNTCVFFGGYDQNLSHTNYGAIWFVEEKPLLGWTYRDRYWSYTELDFYAPSTPGDDQLGFYPQVVIDKDSPTGYLLFFQGDLGIVGALFTTGIFVMRYPIVAMGGAGSCSQNYGYIS